jgi:Coenzyme PQQ synthesis protein D (PqqD)
MATPMHEQQLPLGDLPAGNPKHIDGLDITPVDDGYIVYKPEQDRVHYLNATAVLILELCNGRNSAEEIVQLVKDAYRLPEAPVELVHQALRELKAEGLFV